MIAAIIALVTKLFDFINPWSPYWVNKLTKAEQKKEDAQKAMDIAADKGDWDAYDKARADKNYN